MNEADPALADDRRLDRLVRRRRLFRALARDWPTPLTLVTAPAGFGKTTAIERWLADRKQPAVWIALDRDDNDPVLLWSRIIDETAKAHGIGAEALRALQGTVGSPRPAIELFAAELRGDETPLAFVLDDLHLIDDAACLRTIEMGAGLLIGTAPLFLLTREEPALPLARLYGRGQLLQIGSDNLAFDREETGELLERYGIELDPDLLEEVYGATGGWPAAVYISALWLRDAPDRREAARNLALPREELADYLLSEVIEKLDPGVKAFMRRSSVLQRMSGELCDHVLRRHGSAARIEQLRATNLLVRADRRHPGWYSYHPLLRRVLLTALEDEEPGAATALHRRASDWFIRQDMSEDAAEQAREGGDFELLADLLAALHHELLRAGRWTTLLRWAEALPTEVLDSRPEVTTAAAMVALTAARPAAEIRRLLKRADSARRRPDSAWSRENEVEWQMLRAASGEDGVVASVAAAKAAVSASAETPQLEPVSRATLSMFLELAGDTRAAGAAARAAIESPAIETRPFAGLLAGGTLALVELAHDRPRIARRHVDAAIEVIERAGIEDGPIASRIYSCEALLCIAEGDIAAADRAADRALENPFDTAPLHSWALLVAADARARRGDFRGAGEALAHATELLEACPDPGRLPTQRAGVAARVARSEAEGTVPVEAISPAELRVLRLLAGGKTRAEVAASLVVSVNTIKTHQRAIYRKLGTGERDAAVARARSHGLLD